jgi:FixJ family two-component response regulator
MISASEPWHFVIASDDDKLCASARLALRRLGFAGTFLRSDLDLVNCCQACRPRLVLLDYSLCALKGLEVARGLHAQTGYTFVLIGRGLPTAVTVAAMKLGALTVLEKPVAVRVIVSVFRSAAGEPQPEIQVAPTQSDSVRAPRSVAERWALKVLRGCEADGDVRTLALWASVAGLSYSSLCETCRLVGVQPVAARDLTRVLRAVMQSRLHGCRIGELLDICDRRTLNALMARAAVDPRREGRDISVDQFLTAQRFVPAGNAGLARLRALLPG